MCTCMCVRAQRPRAWAVRCVCAAELVDAACVCVCLSLNPPKPYPPPPLLPPHMSPLAPTGSFGSQSRGSSSICTGSHARAHKAPGDTTSPSKALTKKVEPYRRGTATVPQSLGSRRMAVSDDGCALFRSGCRCGFLLRQPYARAAAKTTT
jgi:hypothetical protein